MRKYEFTGRTMSLYGHMLKQIVATMSFRDVVSGDVGGWIENENNLSHEDDAWIRDDAELYGNAKVCAASHVLVIGAIGSRDDFTTFYRDKDGGITVNCGCFNGKIDKFIEQVRRTHGDNRHALVYLAAAEFAKTSIDLSL